MKYLIILLFVCSNLRAMSLQEAKVKYPQEHAQILEIIENEDFLEPEQYQEELKEIYFKALKAKTLEFKATDKENKDLLILQSILEGLEYKENEVTILIEEFEKHQKLITAKKWHTSFNVSIDLTSFQRHIDLSSQTSTQKLVSTTKASCIGGGINFKNSTWSLRSNGCLLFGNSNIKEKKGSPQYKESSVPLWGVKITQRVGLIASSSGSELGISLPLFFTHQDLKSPSGNYKVKGDKFFTVAPSLYGRWALDKLFLDTEIGQFMDQSNTYYSIGLGFKF